jgi:hypothetical protein
MTIEELVETFARGVRGAVLRTGDDGYDAARYV